MAERIYRRALCWLRRDLRLNDHTALHMATQDADEVVVAFVFDTCILDDLADRDDRRVTFIHRSLIEIDRRLREHGSMLLVRHGDPTVEIPKLVSELQADAVYTALDFEPYAVHRDRQVANRIGVPLHSEVDHIVQPGDTIFNQSGDPFRVFTPYSKAWQARFEEIMIASRDPDFSRLAPRESLAPMARSWEMSDLGFEPGNLWLEPGETAAHNRLRKFVPKMAEYSDKRDFPALDSTSGLSVHLRFGTISIRECFRAARACEAKKWESELIWREFYSMLLVNFPKVVDVPFQPQYVGLHWPGEESHANAWREGQTGYPLVDAAMRCLRATGWMHNRLRMVVASFLTKDLLVDYRVGEAWFARYLLDFELASNNGGWQWAASVGCDAQPYFRIFNPVIQSQKFDPNGDFIRQWCPELRRLPDRWVHFPIESSLMEQMEADCVVGENYPEPIVEHREMKERAIQLLSVGKG